MNHWWTALLDLLFPPCCPVCKGPVLCHGEICRRCLSEMVNSRELNVVLRRLTALDGCRVLLDYTGGSRKLLHDVKYRRKLKYITHLRKLLKEKAKSILLPPVQGVVPVPLCAERLKERGFNQTTLLFESWAKERNLPWEEVLIRIRTTVPQWRLEANERRKNVKDAFKVTRPEWVKDKSLLLVDDIVTTGITLNECAKALKASGASKVFGLGLAGGADGGPTRGILRKL
ncbi:MAG: phosphoribosyltransferase [Firmicutes bacterium]|nr:phosphoribosyltransferase [Bacillota bacterium]